MLTWLRYHLFVRRHARRVLFTHVAPEPETSVDFTARGRHLTA